VNDLTHKYLSQVPAQGNKYARVLWVVSTHKEQLVLSFTTAMHINSTQ
jgi:hypothetical protein